MYTYIFEGEDKEQKNNRKVHLALSIMLLIFTLLPLFLSPFHSLRVTVLFSLFLSTSPSILVFIFLYIFLFLSLSLPLSLAPLLSDPLWRLSQIQL